MPKVIKFSGTPLSKTRGKGNMRIGANSHDYGTSYYSMIEPPYGGYTVYENKASGGPSIKIADNEAELINITRESSGTTYASATECLAWFATQTDKLVVSSNDSFHDYVTDGLVLELDASNLPSYPTTGTTWYDLSGNNNHATLSSPFDSEFSFNSNHFESRPTTQLNELDSSDGSVWEVSYSSELSPTKEWTVGGLLRISGSQSSNGTGWFHKTGNGDERGIHLEPIGSTFRINGFSGWSHLNVNVSAYHNKWAYYTATYKTTGTYGTSTGDLKFYVNGELLGSISTFIPKADTTSIIRLGRRNGHYQHFLNGDTATYQYYTKELSESEIKQNYYGAVVPDNPKIVLNNKKVSSFYNNQWSQNMTGLYSDTNLPSGYISHNDLNGDFDGLTEFTYCLWLKVHNVPVGYSHSAFNKYAGTTTAVVRLYQFGTTSGSSNLFKFYVNGGGAWGDVGGGYYGTNGETFFMVIQYNSTDRGQLWINGQKVGSRGGRSGTIASNTANFYIYPENGTNTNSTVKEAYVYNHELTDQEILTLFNSTRGNHGI